MQSRNRGFTLIELLVVIAIIAVLAGILFPVFMMVRAKARIAHDTATLHQIGANLAQYMLDNANHAPPFLYGPKPLPATGDYCPINPTASFLSSNDLQAKRNAARKCSFQDDGYGHTLYNFRGLDANGWATDYYTGVIQNSVWPAPGAAAWQSSAAGIQKFTDFPILLNKSRPAFTIVTWAPYHRKDASDGDPPYDNGTIIILRVDGSVKVYANESGNRWSAPNSSAGNLTPFQYQSER